MTSTPPSPTTPALPPVERVRYAYLDRSRSDYVFEQPGLVIFLVIITCGIYGYYVFYQLMRRMRDHNRRRLELLEATTEFAWQEASNRGVAEELRPNFERISTNLAVLRQMTTDFRDPALWLVIAIVSGIAVFVAYVFLDQDLIKHDRNEGAIEAELALIFGRLGRDLSTPDPLRVKQPHNYAGRIVASVFTCGVYAFWWQYDLMRDVNVHFAHNWPWEDTLASAVYEMSQAG